MTTKHQKKQQVPIAYAFRIAEQLVELFAPLCDRIEIAGSIRRQKPLVGDIEIVCVPKWHTDLLGQIISSHIDTMVDGWARRGDTSKSFPLLADRVPVAFPPLKNGPRFKQFRIATPPADAERPLRLDLFTCETEAWGPALAMRTGPAEFSKRLVTHRDDGGLLDERLCIHDGYKLWRGRLIVDGQVERVGTLIPCDDEREFLEKYAGGWRDPEKR